MDFPYTSRVAAVNAVTLASLADAPRIPRGVTIDTSDLSEDTTLSWKRNREPDLARYEVVYRSTTSPVWQHAIPVGKATRRTVRISKDDVFFGVRAVDRAGHASPVAFALPSA